MENDFSSSANELFLPVLVLLAGHDEIVDNARVKRWFNALPIGEKAIKTFADFRHVMPFEEDVTPLSEAVSDWMKEREAVASQNIKN